MKNNICLIFALATFCLEGYSLGQSDFFWSTGDVGSGLVVNQDIEVNYRVGESESLYLYWSTNGPLQSQLRIGGGLEVATSNTGVIGFDFAETLDFDIVLANDPSVVVGERWESSTGGGMVGPPDNAMTPDLLDGLDAFTLFGPGITNDNTGNVFLDTGYDAAGDGFLFARVDFTALAPGSVQLLTSPDRIGIVDDDVLLDPVFGSIQINVVAIPEPSAGWVIGLFAALVGRRKRSN